MLRKRPFIRLRLSGGTKEIKMIRRCQIITLSRGRCQPIENVTINRLFYSIHRTEQLAVIIEKLSYSSETYFRETLQNTTRYCHNGEKEPFWELILTCEDQQKPSVYTAKILLRSDALRYQKDEKPVLFLKVIQRKSYVREQVWKERE